MSYMLVWYRDADEFPDDPEMHRGWTAQDYTLADALSVASNVDAELLVAAELHRRAPRVAARTLFSSEAGCFFAYTTTERDMRTLAAVVAALTASPASRTRPGGFLESPVHRALTGETPGSCAPYPHPARSAHVH